MRIESIEIKNFRQYQNVVFNFPKKHGVGDIHIILGENGEGKTNILNAITWCLYGEETHLGNKANALPMINSQYVQTCRNSGIDKGDVSVMITISTEDGPIKFHRVATFTFYGKDPVKTDEKIGFLNSKMDYFEDEDTVSMYLYRYVPQEINDYIFFDGEHLDEYFKEGKRGQIEAGIKGLTQASIVKKTIDGFNRYLKTELNPLLDNADDSMVKDAQKKVNSLTTKYELSQNTVAGLESQKAQCIATLDTLNDVIKGHEKLKEKAIQMEKLEKQIEEFDDQLEQIDSEMMKFTREYYVYFTLYPSMKRLYDYIQTKEKEGNLPPKVDKKLVESILTTKSCPICGSTHLDDKHLEFVTNVLKRLEFSSKTSNELNKASVALQDIFKKISQYKTEVNNRRTSRLFIENKRNNLEEEYKVLNDFMKNVSDSEKIKKAINDREVWSKTKDDLISKIAIESYNLDRTKDELEKAKNELDMALQKNKAYSKLQKQKRFCEDSILVLKRAMDEVLKDCRNELQERTFEIFNQLMWKKDTFKEVIIDEDYIFHLLNNFEEETLGSCSAAERGLLALSFTMALQEISQHDSLLYIDTPLGRVGNKNRINFAEILKDISTNKQVILSFTPSEYDSNVKSILAGNYCSYQELLYKDGLTVIK